LKIEWEQRALGGFEGVEKKSAEGFEVKPSVTFISEFAIERNGIRFPTKQLISETYFSPETKKRFIRSETTVIYDNYKFLTEETAICFFLFRPTMINGLDMFPQ
jgi:hypothetical protein